MDFRLLFLLRIYIHHALGYRAGTHFLQQLAGAVEGAGNSRHIHAAFETSRSLGVQAAGAGCATDAGAIEGCRFKDNRRGLFRHFGFEAAHHTGKTSWLFAICDNELRALGNTGAVIQRMEVFALFGQTGRQAVAGDFIIVIGMHGLAQFHHDEVGHVHYIIDGADACTFETLLHPFRRRANLDVLDHAGSKAIAEIAVDAYLDHVRSLGFVIFFDRDFRIVRLVARKHCCFTHESDNAKAIGAVSGELEFQHDIIEAQHIFGGYTDRRIGRQDVNAVLFFFRQLGKVHLEFFSGAKHTIRRQAAQLALLDMQAIGQMCTNHRHRHNLAFGHILSTRDDLNEFRLTDIHLTNLQMVGIRMSFELFDTARHHFIETFVRADNIFHGNAGHGVFVGQFFGRFVKFYVIVQPFNGNLHGVTSLIRTAARNARHCRRTNASRQCHRTAWRYALRLDRKQSH